MLFSDSCVWEQDGPNQLPGIIGAQGPASPQRATVWAEIFIILVTLLPILQASEFCFQIHAQRREGHEKDLKEKNS